MQELEYNERRLTVQISQYNKEKAKERAEKRARNHKLSEDGWESGITEITDIGEDEQELLLDEEAQK